MLVHCSSCNRTYDDESRWTICPHGPLWAGPYKYCAEHDLINCPHHGSRRYSASRSPDLLSVSQVEAEQAVRDPAETIVEVYDGIHRYLGTVRDRTAKSVTVDLFAIIESPVEVA